ncbi:MAG: aldo/keto reductase [Cyanobacteriota bacterium]|nr:aldo/keto reductase [Cyanobacteriota bacterium]
MVEAPATPAPPIGVGTWAWGNSLLWGYHPDQDRALEACFRHCLARGLRFFDTADSYGTGRFNGRSEALLGQFAAALPAGSPDRPVIATKLAPFPWRLGRGGFRRAFLASRARLQGHLDRVQLHWSTARYAPWQEPPLLEGLADLVLAAEVAELGVSNMGPQRLRRVQAQLAARGVPLTSLQVQFSLLARQPLEPGGVVEVCRELGIELIAYSPLALGVLARPPGPLPALPGGLRGQLFRRLWPAIQPLLEAMAAIGHGRPGGQAAVALNWCRAHGAMPIVGLRSVPQAQMAAAAGSWTLAIEERDRLDQASALCRRGMPANPFQSP